MRATKPDELGEAIDALAGKLQQGTRERLEIEVAMYRGAIGKAFREGAEPMEKRMIELVNSFPTLRGVLEVWDPERLDSWASGHVPCSAAKNAARFVLSVWDRREWNCGAFELHRALSCWDELHRGAFLAWVKNPWWA